MSETHPYPVSDLEMDNALLENQVRNDLRFGSDGSPLDPLLAAGQVGQHAAEDPEYYKKASEVLARDDSLSDPTDRDTLRRALHVSSPALHHPYDAPRTLPTVKKLRHNPDFQATLSKTTQVALNLRKGVGKEADLIEAQKELRASLASDPDQIVLLRKKRDALRKKSGDRDEKIAKLEQAVARRRDAMRNDGRGLEKYPENDPKLKDRSLPWIPVISSTRTETGINPNTNRPWAVEDVPGWRIRGTRLPSITRVKLGDEPHEDSTFKADGRKRWTSSHKVELAEHARKLNEHADAPLEHVRAQLALAEARDFNEDGLDYASFEALLGGISGLDETNSGVSESIRSSYSNSNVLNSQFDANQLSMVNDASKGEAAAFTSLRESLNYLRVIDQQLEHSQSYNPEYAELLKLRADILQKHNVGQYRIEQMRITHGSVGSDGTIDFKGKIGSQYADQDKGIRINDGSGVVVYPDGSYRFETGSPEAQIRRNSDSSPWSPKPEPSGPKPQILRGLPNVQLYAKQHEAMKRWFMNQTDTRAQYEAQQYSAELKRRYAADAASEGKPEMMHHANIMTYWEKYLDPELGKSSAHGAAELLPSGAVVQKDANILGLKGNWTLRPDGSMSYDKGDGSAVRHFDGYSREVRAA